MKYWGYEGTWMGSTGVMKYWDGEYWGYEVLGWGVLGL